MSWSRYRFLYPRYEWPSVWPVTTRRAICLDLDETLIKTWERRRRPVNLPQDNLSRAYDLNFNGDLAWGMRRPHLDRFLRYCRSRFDLVLVWTAGTREYANQIVSLIFNQGFQPNAVYSQEHCAKDSDGLYKPLDRIYADWDLQPSELLMLDNNHTVFTDTDRHNLIHIPDYAPNPSRLDDDTCLLELERWLSAEPLYNDVRVINKTQIFSKPPVTVRYAQPI